MRERERGEREGGGGGGGGGVGGTQGHLPVVQYCFYGRGNSN